MSYVQSNVNGAMGITQLAKLDRMNARRAEIASKYLSEFESIEGVDFLRVTDGANHNWHLFGLLVPPKYKYWLLDALRAEGIMSNVHYTPLHRNKYYRHLGTDQEFPGSMEFFDRLLRIPIYPGMTDAEAESN